MRISDWSSDVCSSDLDGVVRAAMAGLEAMATQLAGFVNTDSALSASAAGQVVTITGPADATLFTVTTTAVDGSSVESKTSGAETDPRMRPTISVIPAISSRPTKAVQIGRASCRERACQYV